MVSCVGDSGKEGFVDKNASGVVWWVFFYGRWVKNVFVGRVGWKYRNFCACFLKKKDMDVVVGTKLEDLVEVDSVAEL